MVDSYDILQTPDYSPLLVHLIRNGQMASPHLIAEDHPLHPFKNVGAKDRLINILTTKKIFGTPMNWIPGFPEAVCFTECIWQALVRHTDVYSSFGIVFNKHLIHGNGGGPALYVRGDHLAEFVARLPQEYHGFIAPFDPEGVIRPGMRLDFLHEREWRLPGVLEFEYSDVEYVIVDSIQDALEVDAHIGGQHLRQNQFIPMESYRTITSAWGQS